MTRRTGFIFLLTAAMPLAFSFAQTQDMIGGDRRAFADGLLSRKMYKLALPEYLAVLQSQKTTNELDVVLYRAAECQRRLGQRQDARVNCQKLIEQFPKSTMVPRAGFMLGLILLDEGKALEASSSFDKIAVMPGIENDLRISALYHSGEALERLGGHNQAALSRYAEILKISRTAEVAFFAVLRIAYLKSEIGTKEMTESAMQDYLALAKAPFNARVGAEALYQAARLRYNTENYEEAASLYRQLFQKYPNDLRCNESIRPAAWANFRSGRVVEATGMADRALAGKEPITHHDEWLYLKANCVARTLNADAIAAYDALINKFPNSKFTPPAQYERLTTLFSQEKYAQVLADADTILTPPSNVVDNLYWIQAQSAERVKDYAREVQFYGLLVEKCSASDLAPEAGYRLAWRLQQLEKYKEASVAYHVVITKWPNYELVPKALFASGLCLAQLGQSVEALRDWGVLLTKYPTDETVPEALFQKAMEETKLGESRKALETLEVILSKHPNFKRRNEAKYWKAMHYYELKELVEAEKLLHEAIAENPPIEIKREATFLLGLILQAGGKDAEAAKCFQSILDAPIRGKFTSDRLSWLSEFQYSRGSYLEAEAAAKELVDGATAPDWKEAGYTLLGRAQIALKKYDEAIVSYKAASEVKAGTKYGAESTLRLAEALLEHKKDYVQAEKYFQMAGSRASSPQLVDIRAMAYAGLGACLEGRNDLESALRYSLSVGILFDDAVIVPKALNRASNILVKLNRAEEAAQVKAELMERYPDSAEAKALKTGSAPSSVEK